MKKFITSILWVLIAFHIYSNKTFEYGNEMYNAQHYNKAIEAFEELINSGIEDPVVYYNLGNCYFKIQKFPSAILNYEKALKLDPSNEDAIYNLSLSKGQIIDKIEELPRFWLSKMLDNISGLMHSNTWAKVINACLILCLIWIAVFIFSDRVLVKKIGVLLAALLLLSAFIGYGLGNRQFLKDSTQRFAIVFQENVYIKNAPSQQSSDAFILHEGTKVEILDKVGQWLNIKIADGKIGWIKAEGIRAI